ncbi:MAG: hypothetical protein MO852_05905 [Candidatus Devosia euplotis]|nr:hypothetical protein [Candidatus Devosia euplotis]
MKPLLLYAESDDEVDRLLSETIAWRTRDVIVTAGNIAHERAQAILERGHFLPPSTGRPTTKVPSPLPRIIRWTAPRRPSY